MKLNNFTKLYLTIFKYNFFQYQGGKINLTKELFKLKIHSYTVIPRLSISLLIQPVVIENIFI